LHGEALDHISLFGVSGGQMSVSESVPLEPSLVGAVPWMRNGELGCYDNMVVEAGTANPELGGGVMIVLTCGALALLRCRASARRVGSSGLKFATVRQRRHGRALTRRGT
jgi:hypothetical protein